uniref:lycopene beta-cyclase n=1 Tax=Aureoumbra lagunensis TaxID=44058 RepID=A0A7S3K058_9STRA
MILAFPTLLIINRVYSLVSPVASSSRFDVAVIGSGPAGSTAASLLAKREGLRVALIDPKIDDEWPNNYGSWADEWSALAQRLPEFNLEECTTRRWETTDCFFGGSWGIDSEVRTKLDRAYVRVDRIKLREACISEDVERIADKVSGVRSDWALNVYQEELGNGIQHDATGTRLKLSSGREIRATIIIDATGFNSRLTLRGETPAPGFQIAYGFEADVKSLCDYDPEAMLLFDYRDDYLPDESKNKDWPTFMYAMPMGPGLVPDSTRVFFEETVLVSRPAMSVHECERRAIARLESMGIEIISPRSEIELCYIPMGGPTPDPRQRIIAFGAAAGLVHPATGYQLCRCLSAVSDLTAAIGKALKTTNNNPDLTAQAAYGALWPKKILHQRDFALFGAEFLLTCDAKDLRGWFDAFFKLPNSVWGGFLAGWPGLPGNHHHETRLSRLLFGLDMFRRLPPPVALKLVSYMVQFSFQEGPALLRSVTPFFGDNPIAFQDTDTVLRLQKEKIHEEH